MLLTTEGIKKIVDPGVRKNFVDEYKLSKVDLGLVFKIGNQESKTDVYENYTGLAQLSPVAEAQTYGEDIPIKAYGVALTPTKFGKVLPVTYEMRKWAKTKEIFDGAKLLGRAAARTEQTKGASVLINGHDSNFISMTDNKSLFASDHPRADGGASQSNASSLKFSEENIEALQLQMEGALDDRGQLIESMANKIVIPPALRKPVLEVFKAEGKSGTSDNDPNVYKMQEYYGTMKIVVWDYLGAAAGGSDTAFTLLDDSVHQLLWQWAEKANISRDEATGFGQDVIKYKVRDYFATGWRDWRGTLGSTGLSA